MGEIDMNIYKCSECLDSCGKTVPCTVKTTGTDGPPDKCVFGGDADWIKVECMTTRVSVKHNGTVVFSTEIDTNTGNEFEIVTTKDGRKGQPFIVIIGE